MFASAFSSEQSDPTHKSSCKCENHLLKVHLCPDRISDPPIFRTLSCTVNAPFEDFHDALQISFGWPSTHTYDFEIKDPIEEARRGAEEEEEAQFEYEICEESVERMMQSMMLNGTPGSQTRYLLRIVEEDSYGPDGMMSGKGVDSVQDKARQHPQKPEKFSTKIGWQDVLSKS